MNKQPPLDQVLNLSNSDRMIGTFLVFAHLFFMYVRPQEYIPGIGLLRPAGIAQILVICWGVFHIRGFLLRSPLVIMLILACIFALGGISAINVSAYKLAIKYVTQFFPIGVAIYLIVSNREYLLRFINLWCIIYFFVAVITIGNGGRGPGNFTMDENDAALALCMGLPIVFFSIYIPGISSRTKYIRMFIALSIVAGIIVTSSRGGFLGLISVLLGIWWLSGRRLKIAVKALIIGALFSSIVLSILPEGYVEDMQSISNTEDDTRVERFRSWHIAWLMYLDNPVLGVGAGNYMWNSGTYQKLLPDYQVGEKSLTGRVTHSMYFQLLSEVGTLGSFFYFYVIFYFPLKLYRYLKNNREETDDQILARLVAKMLTVSMLTYIVSGAFISVAYYPHFPIWLIFYAVFWRYLKMLDIEDTKS